MDIKQLTEGVERISQLYAEKFNIQRDSDWFVLKLQEELGELIQSYLMMTKRGRTKGRDESEIQQEFTDEVTDVFAHLLLLAHFYHIDLEKSLEKWLQWDKEKKINQTEAI